MGKIRKDKLQLEGNHEAAEQLGEAEQASAKADHVELAASQTTPQPKKEVQGLLKAEKDTQKHPKGVRSKISNATVKSFASAKATPHKMG